jgi:putative transposase
MKKSTTMYKRHRFPPEIIQHAVWLYYRFNLSHRDIEDLLAVRSIVVSYESVRLWCNKFGPKYARRLKRRHQGFGDTFFIDEVFVKIDGIQHFLWRAVDQDGEVVDVFLQSARDGKAAKRFFGRLLKIHRNEPRKIVTEKLRSYGVAHRELIPETIPDSACCRIQFIQSWPSPCFMARTIDFSDCGHLRLGIVLQHDRRFSLEFATAE